MRAIERFFTRRRRLPRFDDVSDSARRRLNDACRELSDAEDRMAALLHLPNPPRLLLVDEEEAVVITPEQRDEIAAVAARSRDRRRTGSPN